MYASYHYLKILVPVLFFIPWLCSAQLRVVPKNDGLLVKEAGTNVLFYVTKDRSLAGKNARAHYIHPLFSMAGDTLTEDFPADHVHQRGIFWAWHQLYASGSRLGNSWLVKDFSWDVMSTQHEEYEDHITLHSTVLWKSYDPGNDIKNKVAVLKEQCSITLHKREPMYRVIDFHLRFEPLLDSVFIGGSGDTKGYGGFSARLKLPGKVKFVSTGGEVIPQTNSVQAGGWMDVQFSQNKEGIILVDSPSNPGFPNPWILREKNSMQNIKYPGRTPLKLRKDNPLILKYRLIVYQSPLEREIIEKLQHF